MTSEIGSGTVGKRMDKAGRVDSRSARVRVVLIAILVLLLLLLVGLGYFISKVVTPVGAPGGAADLPLGLQWVRSIYGYGPAEGQQFRRPIDVAIGPDGSIWATDPQRVRVLGFNPDGSYRTLVHTGPTASGKGKMAGPEGLAVGADGLIYIADAANNKIMVFTPQGGFLREWPVPGPLVLAVRDGRVYAGCLSGVAVFTTEGRLLSLWGKRGMGPEEFDTVHGIAIGADGTVYLSDTNNRRVKAYKPDGTLLWIWPKSRTTALRSGVAPKADSENPLQVPAGMTIDGQGRLVLVDSFSFDAVVLRPGKTGAILVGRYGSHGQKDGFFIYPTGIAYDSARDWFAVSDTNNDRIQVVRLPGTASPGLAAAVRRSLLDVSPWCAVPLGLLIAGVLLVVLRRRARNRVENVAPEVPAS